MILQTLSFSASLNAMAAAVVASARSAIDLTVGSVLRAILEANATVGLWIQSLILQTLTLTRAASSVGADLDSWMADYGMARLPANGATGQLTFSRASTATAALVPVGAQAKSADGTQTFTVYADATNGAWNGSTGFTIAPGQSSVTVYASAVNKGVVGNVLVNTVTQLAASIPYVDSVNNANAFSGGIDAESDAALRARFQLYLASRSLATPAAVAYAVASVQQNLTYTIAENALANGTYAPGWFVVSFDDGSGAPSNSLLATVTAAVNAVRGISINAIVQKATLVTANVSLTLTCANTALHTAALTPVNAAIVAYIASLPVGSTLSLSKLAQVVFNSSPNVLNVTAATINSVASDLVATPSQVIRAGTVTLN